MTIRVLIVDDSVVMCELIARKLGAHSDIEVVGRAHNANEARQLIKRLDPDVVTLDIEMPGMDGLSFLEKIMALRPTPVTIVSSMTSASAKMTTRALRLGAVNCYEKSSEKRSIRNDDGGELARLVREASMTKVAKIDAPKKLSKATVPRAYRAPETGSLRALKARRAKISRERPDVIVIGASTGGVEALTAILREIPEDCPPTLVVQHVHPSFTAAIAQTLDKIAAPRVQLAQGDMVLSPGLVLIAPGDTKHLEVMSAGQKNYLAVLRDGEPTSGHRPSIDRLFGSAAKAAGNRALGIILTGMGEDGARELLTMAKAGAHTIAQDQETCVVFGMPRAAIALGAAKSVVPLGQIAKQIFGHNIRSQERNVAPAAALSLPSPDTSKPLSGVSQSSARNTGQGA